MELRSGYALGLRESEQRGALTPDHVNQLRRGVTLVFARWTALQLAIANQWGGPDSQEKARELVEKTVQWLCETKEVYADELEELLDAELFDHWNTQAEDESPRDVSQLVTKIFYETVRNQGETVDFLARSATTEMRQLQESLQEPEPQAPAPEREPQQRREKPQVDEDGWTTVPTRKR